MLSTLWELILLDLKGKENLKRDSRWVVTQCKLALLKQALIKYQREALAVLALQGGDSLSSSLTGLSITTDSHSKNTAALNPKIWSTPQPPLLITPLDTLSRKEPLSPSDLPPFFTLPSPLAERKALFEVSQILLFPFFFFSPLERF